MSPLPRSRPSKVLSGLLSVSDLFPRQFREVDSGSGRKNSRFLPVLWNQINASAVWRPVHSADQLTKLWCTRKGTRGSVAASPAVSSEYLFQSFPSDLMQVLVWTLEFTFFFPILRKWLQKYWSGQIILFYLFLIFPHFPHLTKNKSRSPPPFLLLLPSCKTENGNALL